MTDRLGQHFSRWARRWVPDPFVLALGLTFLVFVVAVARLNASTAGVSSAGQQVLEAWFSGFTAAAGFAFALQMCLVLVTGHALALSPPIQAGVKALANLAFGRGDSNRVARAAALVAFISCLAGVAHWGLGAIVGAFLAREIGREAKRRGVSVDYPLLGAAAYSGLAVWHGGLSGSAPLKAAEGGGFVQAIVGRSVPVAETLFSMENLAITGGLIVLITGLYAILGKRRDDHPGGDWQSDKALSPSSAPGADDDRGGDVEPSSNSEPSGLMERLQHAPFFGRIVGAIGLGLIGFGLATGALSFDLNFVNFLFLFLGLLGQGSVTRYVAAVSDGARGAGGIIVQFPFYFGILGMMKAGGLVAWLSEALISVSSATTFPVLSFLSAGLVNLVVPSGGGQWAVQGELVLRSAVEQGVDPGFAILAFSYGDAWTNMLQPFWALPLLGIMGLRAKDIVGSTLMVFLLMAVFVPLMLLAFAA